MAQAGIGSAPVQGKQAGLTMSDRQDTINALRSRGFSDSEIEIGLGISKPTDAPAEVDDGYTFGDKAEWAARQAVGMPLEGVGKRLGLDWLTDMGEAISPDEEMQQERAEARQARADAVEAGEMTKTGELARNVGDSVVESSGSLGGAMATGAAGGAALGLVAGPMGAAVGAALGAAAYGIASMYGEAYDQAEQNGLDVNDPNVKAHIDTAALAGGALDAIPSFRILRKFAPAAAKELVVKKGTKGILKHAGKEGAKEFATEGVTEASQEALQAVLLDPDVVAALSTKEKMELAPEILQQHGPEFLEAFLAGAILGGTAGGVGGGVAANRAQKLAVQKEAFEKEQGKADMTAAGRIAEDQFIPAEALEPGEDADKAADLKAELRAIREAEGRAAISASLFNEASQRQMPEEEIAPIREDAERKVRAVQKMKDDFAVKRGGLTKAAADATRKQEAEIRSNTAKNHLRKSGITVTNKEATPEQIEEHATKVADARSKTAEARNRYKSAPEQTKPRRRKQLEKAIVKEAEALEAADVALGEREPRARYNEHIGQMASLVRAADREGAKDIFMQRDWADIDTLTPEQRVERAQEIIGKHQVQKGPKAEELKKKIKNLRAKQENVQSPDEFYNIQEQIDAAQADLKADTPRVEAARDVISAAQAEIRSALEAQAEETQPTTADSAAQEEGAGSAEPGASPEGTVEGSAETASKAATVEPSTGTDTVNPLNVTPEARKALGEARKAFRNAPTDARALSDLEAAGRKALAEAGLKSPTPEQLNEAIRGGGSVAQRIVRASRMAQETAAVQEPSTPVAAVEEVPAANETASPSSPQDLAAGVVSSGDAQAKIASAARLRAMDDGGDISRNKPWRSLRESTDIALPMEEQEQWMREQTAADPKHSEIAAVFMPDGTLAGIGTNGDHNGVTAPRNGWGAGGTYTHSHPFETPMSPADVGMMKAGKFSVLRAILPSQTVEIRPGPNLTPKFDPADYYYHADRAMRQVLEDAGKSGINEIAYARITQEANLQAMHVDGLIDYTIPMEGFTDEERGFIDSARTGILADARRPGAQPDVGLRPAEAGTGRGQDGQDRPQLAAGTAEGTPEIDIAAYRKALEKKWKTEGAAKFVTFDDLMEVAPANQKLLVTIGYRIAADLGVTFKDGGVKGRMRSEQKMAEKGVNAGALTDVVRGGFMASTTMEAGQIANALQFEMTQHGIEVMDEGLNVTDAGYFDQKLMVRFPNGQVGEVQVWEPHLFLAKEGRNPVTMDRVEGFTKGHDLYVQSRDLPAEALRTPEEQARFDELGQQMRALYASAASLAHPSFQALVLGKDPSLAAASGNRLRQLLSDIVPADPEANMLREQGFQFSPNRNTNVSPVGSETTGSVSANPNSIGPSFGDADSIAPAAGLANPEDVKPKRKLRAADPEKIGELATATHQRILDRARAKRAVKGNAYLATLDNDILNGTITPEHLSNAFMEAADHIDRELSQAIDAMADALYPEHDIRARLHEKGIVAKEVMALGGSHNEVLQRARVAALAALNEMSEQTGAKFEQQSAYARQGRRKVSVSMLKADRKMRRAIGHESTESARFSGPGDFDPNDTSGWKLGKHNILEGAAAERAKAAIRVAQRNQYRIIPSELEKLDIRALLGDAEFEELYEKTLANPNDPAKFKLAAAQGKIDRLHDAVERHAREFGPDAPIMFRWRADDKGRIYADGEFTPQSKQLKHLFSGNGTPLSDMWEVDHTGSGWQVAAIAARDDTLAPTVNIHGGQMGLDAPVKGDIYADTRDTIHEVVRRDAAAGDKTAQIVLKGLVENPNFQGKLGRLYTKTPVIAINYGGGAGNFQRGFTNADGNGRNHDFTPALEAAAGGKLPEGLWGYINNMGITAVEEMGPATARMKKWATNLLRAAIGAANQIGAAEDLEWTVGTDARYAKTRYLTEKDSFEVFDRRPNVPIGSASRDKNRERPTMDIDIDGTARTIFSQKIQGFDAEILHKALARFGEENPGVFVSPNHDSYTLEPQHAPAIAKHVREVMHETLGKPGALVDDLYADVVEQVGMDRLVEYAREFNANLPRGQKPIDIEALKPFDGFGTYDPQEILTAIPMWAEGPGIDGAAPPNAPVAKGIESMPTAEGITDVNYQSETYDRSAMEQVPGIDARISTRAPLQMQSDENMLVSDLQIDQASMEADPETFAYNMSLIPDYPGMNDITGTPQEIAAEFKRRMVENLLWLHDNAPEVLRKRGWHWYDGARRISETWAERYQIPPEGVAAALAALSPQKDWFQNVSLTERVLDTLTHRRDFRWSAKMAQKWHSIDALAEHADKLQAIKGKTLQEVIDGGDPYQIAAWVRAFDETYNDRNYAIITPEGDLSDMAGKDIAWGSLSEIGKAVAVALDPSLENIALSMGDMHKVRSFYNNINSPNSTFGDVTIDTHAVAAALMRALAQSDAEVSHVFGTGLAADKQPEGYRSARAVGKAGSKGLYGLYADAYREAASQRGLLPRQMQSITWEAVRLLYPDAEKRGAKALPKAIDDIWSSGQSIEEKRNAAFKRAGGIGQPSWARPGGSVFDPAGQATYKTGLPVQRGAQGGGNDAGTGSGAAGAIPPVAGRLDPSRVNAVGKRSDAAARRLQALRFESRWHSGEVLAGSEPMADIGGLEGRPRPVKGPAYATAMRKAARSLGAVGAQVSMVDKGRDVQRFLLDGGESGFALDGDNIIGVFSSATAPKDAAGRLIRAAVAAGGRRLDGFDTFLPKLYARNGFRGVARLGFNPEYAPTIASPRNPDGALANWDADAMEAMGRDVGKVGWGSPDVVFMVYDPAKSSPDTNNLVETYEEGIAAQDAALAAMPRAEGIVNRDTMPLVNMGTTRANLPRSAPQPAGAAPGAEQILDEISRGTQSLSPAARKELAQRVVAALDAGNINNLDLYRLGMTPEGLIRMQTLAATGDRTYGGADGRAVSARDGAVPRLEGNDPEVRSLLDAMPIAQGITSFTGGPGAIFGSGVDEAGVLRGLTASYKAGDHPARTLAKLRHNEAPFNGSRYEAILGKTRSEKENLTAQLNYATDLANYLDEVSDRLPARFAQFAEHLKRMGDMQLYIADERGRRRDTSVQIKIPVAMGVTAPEGMDLGLPETYSVFNAALDVAKNPGLHARTFMQKVEDGMFNRMAPIRRLEIAVNGELGIGAESAYKAAETAVNDSGRNEALMFYHAAKLGAHGEFTGADGTVGLRTIFDTVVGTQKGEQAGQTMADWMGWMAARRIEGLLAKNPGIRFPMKDLQAALAKEQPQFAEAAEQWQRHNNANIDFLVDTGRISKEMADAMKEDEFYVPFYRSDAKADGSAPELVFPDNYGFRRGGGGNTILSRNPGIHKLVGGDKQAIDNIMRNMIRNSQAMVAAGMRNQAANQIFDLMGQAGLVTKTKARQKGKSGNYVDVAKPTEHAVKLWINGKAKWAIPQPGAEPYLVAMAGLQPIQLRGIMAVMANVSSIFRQGITLSPVFMARNLIRGMVANGLLTTGANLTWQNNTLSGLRNAYHNGAATRAFKAQSGMGDFRFGGHDVGFGKDDIFIEYGLAPKTWGSRLRKAIDKAEHIGTATEMADRVAAMNTMISRGMRPDEAAYQARAVMDYARHGGWPAMRAYLPLVPFLNARLQGLSRLTEGAIGRSGALGRKQAALQLALNGALLSIISAAIWGLNQDDEEKRERYKAEPLHRRLNSHIVYVGDTAFYIPKAFELGHLFSSIPEIFLDATFRDMGDEVSPALKQIFATTVGMNLIPAGALPLIEGQANYSFFRQGPIESRREQDMAPRDRVTGASALSRFIGQQLHLSDVSIPGFEMILGVDQGKISPAMIEHYMQGYFGTYFHFLSGSTDMVTAELGLGSAPVGGAWGDIPVASRAMERIAGTMVRRNDQQSTKYMEEFYRNKDWITQIYRSAKDAAANGDVEYARHLLEESPGTPAAYKLVNKASSRLGDISAAIRSVRADTTMSPAQKRAKIEPLIRERNNFVREVALLIRKIEEQQGSTFRSGT